MFIDSTNKLSRLQERASNRPDKPMTYRDAMKKIFRIAAAVTVFPLYLFYLLLSSLFDSDGIFSSFSQILSVLPGKTGSYLRAAFYAFACNGTSNDIVVGFLTLFSHVDTTIEAGVYIGPQSNIGKCNIGRNCLLGSGVHVLSGSRQHRFSNLEISIKEQGGSYEKISIGEDCWIGNGAIVMANLGDRCIVAAGSVVTKPFPDNLIVAGNPAREIARR